MFLPIFRKKSIKKTTKSSQIAIKITTAGNAEQF